MTTRHRCSWAEGDPLMSTYHDTEWGVPQRDIARLMADPGIVRARAKIEATIRGAQIWCNMEEAGASFSQYCWSFTEGKPLQGDGRWVATTPLSERISKDMKKRGFKFVGPTIVHAWMQAVGIVNDHSLECFRRKQVAIRQLSPSSP